MSRRLKPITTSVEIRLYIFGDSREVNNGTKTTKEPHKSFAGGEGDFIRCSTSEASSLEAVTLFCDVRVVEGPQH